MQVGVRLNLLGPGTECCALRSPFQPLLCHAIHALAVQPCHALPCHAVPCHAMPCHALHLPCAAMPSHVMKQAPSCHASHATHLTNELSSCTLHYLPIFSFSLIAEDELDEADIPGFDSAALVSARCGLAWEGMAWHSQGQGLVWRVQHKAWHGMPWWPPCGRARDGHSPHSMVGA